MVPDLLRALPPSLAGHRSHCLLQVTPHGLEPRSTLQLRGSANKKGPGSLSCGSSSWICLRSAARCASTTSSCSWSSGHLNPRARSEEYTSLMYAMLWQCSRASSGPSLQPLAERAGCCPLSLSKSSGQCRPDSPSMHGICGWHWAVQKLCFKF